MARTSAQGAASRRNGKKGGAPKGTKQSPDKLALARLRANKMLNLETEASVQFLVDLRDGIIVDSTVADRRMAAESILDRCPELARSTRKVDDVTGAGDGVRREFKTVVKTAHAAPVGWVGEGEAPKQEA